MKHIPTRTCIVCREQKEKGALVRIVVGADGSVCVDKTGKMPGRGAYICADGDCATSARKKRALDRAFKTKFADSEYDKLVEALAVNDDER